MTRDEVLGNCYTPKGLVKAAANGFLFDYVAQWYYQMTTYELKEVLLAVLGVVYDNCGVGANRDTEEEALAELIVDELANRDFGQED